MNSKLDNTTRARNERLILSPVMTPERQAMTPDATADTNDGGHLEGYRGGMKRL
jgi:hypothetical protein